MKINNNNRKNTTISYSGTVYFIVVLRRILLKDIKLFALYHKYWANCVCGCVDIVSMLWSSTREKAAQVSGSLFLLFVTTSSRLSGNIVIWAIMEVLSSEFLYPVF